MCIDFSFGECHDILNTTSLFCLLTDGEVLLSLPVLFLKLYIAYTKKSQEKHSYLFSAYSLPATEFTEGLRAYKWVSPVF